MIVIQLGGNLREIRDTLGVTKDGRRRPRILAGLVSRNRGLINNITRAVSKASGVTRRNTHQKQGGLD